MSNSEVTIIENEKDKTVTKDVAQQVTSNTGNQGDSRTFEKNRDRIKSRNPNKRNDNKKPKEKDGLEHKIISVRRVSKMNTGGRRMNLSVFVVVGDKKGRVGLGVGKGDDVKSAQEKAISKAKKGMIFVQLKGNTIPHEILHKYKAAKVLLKPASPGTGVIAGSSVRMIAEVAGINDMLSKIISSNNPITTAYATIQALSLLRLTKL